jgi:hypothetical protein
MAHFARLDHNNNVVHVHVVDNENLLDENGVEQESVGIAYLQGVHGVNHNWKQCSYNGTIRKHYPGVGWKYDDANDVFIAPQPFQSWTLDSNFNWQCPVATPSFDVDTQFVRWNEENQQWDILSIPTE